MEVLKALPQGGALSSSLYFQLASVAELADAQDLGSCPARGPGSTPGVRTFLRKPVTREFYPLGIEELSPFPVAASNRCALVASISR